MKHIFLAFLLLSLNGVAQKVKSLIVPEFESMVKNEEVQLLDVRKAEEFKSGHLQGAFQADWTNRKEFEQRVQFLDKTKPLFIYCLSGGRSAAAAAWLAENGFTNVVNLQGGISAWKKEGKEVEAKAVMQQMSNETFTSLIHSSHLVLVEFGANWCPPCKKMEPVITQLQKEYKNVKIIKIDAGVENELMEKNKVEALPEFILFKKGIEVWRQQGVTDKSAFDKILKQYQ